MFLSLRAAQSNYYHNTTTKENLHSDNYNCQPASDRVEGKYVFWF